MERAAQRIITLSLSVRQTENYVQGLLHPEKTAKKDPRPEPPIDPNVREVQDRLQRALGLKVHIEEKIVDPRDRMAWKLFLWAGNRCGEIRGLRWRCVIWDYNTIIVTESVWQGNSTPTKSKKGNRKLVLTSEQMAELKEYKDTYFPNARPDDWMFPGARNRPIGLAGLMRNHVKPIAQALGIDHVHWHAIRHLNNSIMLAAGVDVKTRMDRLGHVSENTNMIYSHVGDAAQLAASEAIWKRLETARQELRKRLSEEQTEDEESRVLVND
jgi:integrase